MLLLPVFCCLQVLHTQSSLAVGQGVQEHQAPPQQLLAGGSCCNEQPLQLRSLGLCYHCLAAAATTGKRLVLSCSTAAAAQLCAGPHHSAGSRAATLQPRGTRAGSWWCSGCCHGVPLAAASIEVLRCLFALFMSSKGAWYVFSGTRRVCMCRA